MLAQHTYVVHMLFNHSRTHDAFDLEAPPGRPGDRSQWINRLCNQVISAI